MLGRRNDELAPLLLSHGADPNVRSSLRKQLRDMREPEQEVLRELRDVTPLEYARGYVEPAWVNEPAISVLEGAGGR